MATKLEVAQTKLIRIQKEQVENLQAIRNEHDRIPFGQPNIIGRQDIYKVVKQKYHKGWKLAQEQEQQEERIEMLQSVENFKTKNNQVKDVHIVGRTGYATIGAKTSVHNLDYFKTRLKELEQENDEAKAFNKTKPAIKKKTRGAEITKLKKKIALLEQMQEKDRNKSVSAKTQALIDSGAVNQWLKKPIYYFVKGLKKVALEIDEQGEFVVSRRYPACSETDRKIIRDLLEK